MKKTIIASLLAALVSTSALADPAAESVIALTGDYIKIGVSDYGTIGSKGNVSPGILYDNTGTRTFNTAYDYLTPGAPFEGFAVKYTAGGATSNVVNNNMGGGPVTGLLYNYSGIAYGGTTYDNRAVWIGSHADFNLTNDVRFNNTQKFIDISSIMTAKVAMTDVYFARFIDPDARAAAGDSSATTNTLGYSPIPATNVVFSEALASKYALGLYTAQVGNVGTGISSSWSTDPITYFSGTNGGNGDYTIGIAFKVASMGVNDVATFRYAYIFGPSTVTAGAYAVNSGAAGGTSGVVPGCTTGCDMPGVVAPSEPIPVTPPAPSAPTLVETTTDYVYGRLSVFNRQAPGKTLVIKNTVDTSVQPIYTDRYSDSSTVVRDGVVETAQAINNYQTRIDQYDYLKNANERFNQQLQSNPLDRHEVRDNVIGSKVGDDHRESWMYIIADGQRTNSNGDGYRMTASRFGIGGEKLVEHNWLLGVQFNNINSTLTGNDAGGNLTKNHAGLYSVYAVEDWILKSDLGVAVNDYKNYHSLNTIEELGPMSNSGKTSGRDAWLNNRVYTPRILGGFRPFAGANVISSTRNGLTESGSTLTQMTYDKYSQTNVVGEGGIRFEDHLFHKVNLVAEAGQNTQKITTLKAGLSYSPDTSVLGVVNVGTQRQEGVTNYIVQGNIKFFF